MSWLDANRVFASVFVILIHSTTDVGGQPFAYSPARDRVVPLLTRWIAELSSSELFFVFSLFLLAFKLDRKPAPYGRTVASQASRLLIPFAAWTVFYAFFRLVKASTFGFAPAILHELSQWPSWLSYFVLGAAQYHLHFNPTLFALVLMYPLFEAARRFPVAGLAIFPLLYVLDTVQGYVWGHVGDPMERDYLLRAVKILCYGGYGLAAFALFGIFKRDLSNDDWRLARRLSIGGIVIALMCVLPNTLDAIASGQWGVRARIADYGHFLMPLFTFAFFLSSQAARWSPRFSVIARYTFGVYLTHPIFIDLWDVGMKQLGLNPDPTFQVYAKWLVAAAGALGLTVLLSRIRPLAWLVGLGPAPFAERARVRADGQTRGETAVA
jgi:surface polysaccharide O-acyltransferase-like enzyme